jgi:segregation and condensation protein B
MFIQSPTSLALATAPTVAPLIKKLEADEYSATLGKATLETLALIVYKHPISRADIEHIRGVQSTYSLRTLLMRGLIEKTGKQGFEYQPTAACLAYMGIENIENIPERAALIEHIQNITAHRPS